MIDITASVQKSIREGKIEKGICLVYTPHTTAAITINENADGCAPRYFCRARQGRPAFR
jgi:thiamine phosphate synthase YjbQ (UPF0047 family)